MPVVDDWKRQRLIGAGADFIVPNFRDYAELVDTLFEPLSEHAGDRYRRHQIQPRAV